MDVETSYSDFINCDRTGRRNAVPDIAGEGEAAASTSELTKDLAEMDLKAAGQYGKTVKPQNTYRDICIQTHYIRAKLAV